MKPNLNNIEKPDDTEPAKTIQTRWKSAAAWAAVAALLMLIGNTFRLWDLMGITSDAAQALLNGVLTAVAAFGIFNNPTNSKGF